jgi:cation:H+ antiporter
MVVEQFFFWAGIFIISLLVLLKGADWLVKNAEKIGLHFGLSPFIVGVFIIGIGTSMPELVSSIVASLKGVTEIVVATAVGSNISNILLVVGLAAVLSTNIVVKKNLIYLDIPLLITSTIIFLVVAIDGKITIGESVFLILAYVIYISYSFLYRDGVDIEDKLTPDERLKRPPVSINDYFYLVLGVIAIALGANYLIESTVKMSEITNIGVSIISMFAIALGTSLPELLVTVRAAILKKAELATGNIFGSNFFNILVIVGFPGLFNELTLSGETLIIGLPFLVGATVVFMVSGISNKFHRWDGAMYLMLYILFVSKVFGIL